MLPPQPPARFSLALRPLFVLTLTEECSEDCPENSMCVNGRCYCLPGYVLGPYKECYEGNFMCLCDKKRKKKKIAQGKIIAFYSNDVRRELDHLLDSKVKKQRKRKVNEHVLSFPLSVSSRSYYFN